MHSSNPVFNRTQGFQRGGYATFNTAEPRQLEDMYNAPSATAVDTNRMTLDDVIVRTGALFAALLVSATVTFQILRPGFGIVLISGLIGLGLAIAIGFMKRPNPPLMFGYAAIEGVFVGGLSYFYESAFDGAVTQAILGTLAAFTTMLVMYKTGIVRNSPKFTKVLMIAGAGYLVFALLHLGGVMFGAWDSVYSGGGLLPVLLSAFGVVLASLFLVLDFDFIEQGVRNGLPKPYAWTAAFGLVVTLIWLYLEILRLMAILRGDN